MSLGSVLFVGLGGAGQRHLRILRRRLPQARFMAYRHTSATPLLTADFKTLPGHVEQTYDLTLFPTLPAALDERPDLVVISTPPALHYGPALAAARRGLGLLVEKPWSDSLAGFATFHETVTRQGTPFHLSFQRRFHPLVRRVRDLVAAGRLGRIMRAHMMVASYVPAWHPYEDWRGLYAVRRDLGGGVLLTECHEIDLCCWLFGVPQRVSCVGGNFGPEPLEVEDTVELTLDYENFSVLLSLCFMQREARRSIEIAGTGGHIFWQATGNRLTHVDYASGRRDEEADPEFPNDALFEAQADALLAACKNDTDDQLRSAWASQAIIAAARLSMSERRAVVLPSYPSETVS
jgi:predicted dehydrogenase